MKSLRLAFAAGVAGSRGGFFSGEPIGPMRLKGPMGHMQRQTQNIALILLLCPVHA
jgi:hypothetical protein